MPHLNIRQTKIYYQEAGRGPESLVFSHGLLMSSDMFKRQVQELSKDYRCISYDHRGQGRSEVTANGYDMDSLTEDAASLIQALDCAPCHFIGLSMGGFVGLRLAIHHPELVKSLTLMETSADPEPEQNKGPYRRLAFVGRWLGFRLVAGPVMKIMFGPTFLGDPERKMLRDELHRNLISLNRLGTTRAAYGVIDREGVYDQLGDIQIPTLILVGEEDMATPLPKAERMHEAIAGSKLLIIPRAGHSSSIEEPEAVTRVLRSFLASSSEITRNT